LRDTPYQVNCVTLQNRLVSEVFSGKESLPGVFLLADEGTTP
jgi:hypothetical protein